MLEDALVDQRYRPHCRICNRSLPFFRTLFIHNGLVLCKDHYRQYKDRQHNGVTTDELSNVWNDALANWRERPAELDEELGRVKFSTRLYFRQKYKHWLLFMRFYMVSYGRRTEIGAVGVTLFNSLRRNRSSVILTSSSKRSKRARVRANNRMGDCLAVNVQTGEVRRFVNVSEDMVIDDLSGKRPVPYQEEFAQFWGKVDAPDLQEKFASQYRDGHHRVRIPALVQLVEFPVYGIVGNAFDLQVSSLSINSGSLLRIDSIGFTFSNVRDLADHDVEVTSYSLEVPEAVYSLDDALGSLFWQYRLSTEERIVEITSKVGPFKNMRQLSEQAYSSYTWRANEFKIQGDTFVGEIFHWSQPSPLSYFRLKNEDVVLSGHANGMPLDLFLQLLAKLQMINTHEDILAQYQREIDANTLQLLKNKR